MKLNVDPKTLHADRIASAALRVKMQAAALPKDTPTAPLDPQEFENAQKHAGAMAPFADRCCQGWQKHSLLTD